MFKELFKKLHGASDKEKSDSPIWSVFIKENLVYSSVKEKMKNYPKIFKKFEKYDSHSNIQAFENLPYLDLNSFETFPFPNSDLIFDAFPKEKDTKFWQNLFLNFRDIGCKNIDINQDQVLSVICAGEQREVTFQELNSNMFEDYGDILTTQTTIPERILYQEDKEMLMVQSKTNFMEKVKGKSAEESELVLSNIQNTSEAQRIKDIQSLEAEVFVQKMLIELGKTENISMVVFRGINTYAYLGRNLERFGLKFSKLRYYKYGKIICPDLFGGS